MFRLRAALHFVTAPGGQQPVLGLPMGSNPFAVNHPRRYTVDGLIRTCAVLLLRLLQHSAAPATNQALAAAPTTSVPPPLCAPSPALKLLCHQPVRCWLHQYSSSNCVPWLGPSVHQRSHYDGTYYSLCLPQHDLVVIVHCGGVGSARGEHWLAVTAGCSPRVCARCAVVIRSPPPEPSAQRHRPQALRWRWDYARLHRAGGGVGAGGSPPPQVLVVKRGVQGLGCRV